MIACQCAACRLGEMLAADPSLRPKVEPALKPILDLSQTAFTHAYNHAPNVNFQWTQTTNVSAQQSSMSQFVMSQQLAAQQQAMTPSRLGGLYGAAALQPGLAVHVTGDSAAADDKAHKRGAWSDLFTSTFAGLFGA